MGGLLRDLLRLSGGLWRVAPRPPPVRSSRASMSFPWCQLYSTNSGSLQQFKAWLGQVLNNEKCANGYDIALGKPLDAKFLGFSKMIDLVKECNDAATLQKLKQGCHLAFPVKQNKQKSRVPSPGASNPNPNAKFASNKKASKDDFSAFMYQMFMAGEFWKGFPMSQLPCKFEQSTGKLLDVKHLGCKKLTQLVSQYSFLVSVDKAAKASSRIRPARFIRKIVANHANSSKNKSRCRYH